MFDYGGEKRDGAVSGLSLVFKLGSSGMVVSAPVVVFPPSSSLEIDTDRIGIEFASKSLNFTAEEKESEGRKKSGL